MLRKVLGVSMSVCVFLLPIATRVGAQAPGGDSNGPPPFLTRPILVHVSEAGLDHGHFVFGGEAAIPSPLARDLGCAAFSSAPASTLSLVTGTDRDVSNSSNSYEGETGAVTSGIVLVGGSNHIYPGNCSASAAPGTFGDCAPLAYASTDTNTWTKSSMSRVWNGTTFGIGFDPAVDVDKTGTFYYSYGVAPLSGSFPNAIVVMKSTNGTAWTQATPVTFNTRKDFDDKYYMAIDRSNSSFANRIYVSWDRNSGNNQTLLLSFSSNGGTSWSTPTKVNDGTTKFERVIGAYPAVDHNTGVVYNSWHDYAKNRI